MNEERRRRRSAVVTVLVVVVVSCGSRRYRIKDFRSKHRSSTSKSQSRLREGGWRQDNLNPPGGRFGWRERKSSQSTYTYIHTQISPLSHFHFWFLRCPGRKTCVVKLGVVERIVCGFMQRDRDHDQSRSKDKAKERRAQTHTKTHRLLHTRNTVDHARITCYQDSSVSARGGNCQSWQAILARSFTRSLLAGSVVYRRRALGISYSYILPLFSSSLFLSLPLSLCRCLPFLLHAVYTSPSSSFSLIIHHSAINRNTHTWLPAGVTTIATEDDIYTNS